MSMVATRVQLRVEALESRVVPDATTFVQGLYLDVLDRAADAGGLSFWTTQLTSGEMSHAEVAAEFWFSEEHRVNQVTEYYQRFFNRAPDPEGLEDWVDEFLDGDSEYEVMEEFLTSDEYAALHPTANTFVRGLYEDVLGRTPTAEEENAWAGQLGDDFDDEDIVEAFLSSDEHFLLVIDQYYTDLLHRAGDPGGRQAWLDVLRNGNVEDGNVDDDPDDDFFEVNDESSFEKVAVFFLSSPEYITSH